MELSQRVAYLKGLMDGLKIDDSTDQGKILKIMSDILEDMAWLDNQTIIGHNIDCSATVPADSPAEEAVLQALKPGTLSFEQLSGLTGLSPSELMSSITMLQVKGMIETLPGKFYRIKG